jgi:RNA polymerase sigma-70 factor (ECF subfamily)
MSPSNRTDAESAAEAALVARCLEGDAAAFEAIYRRHAPRIFTLACRMTGSRADGEDLLQEIFLLVHRKLGGFKGDSALGTWIYRLAANCCVDFLRSRQHRERQATDELDETVAPPRSAGGLRVDQMDLQRAIERLPAGYRAAFVLHDVEGFEHAEVARLLGIAEGTSKSQVHKARLKIRALLASPPAARP